MDPTRGQSHFSGNLHNPRINFWGALQGSYGGNLNDEFPEPYEVDDFTIEVYSGTTDSPIGDPVSTFNVGNEVRRIDTEITVNRSTQIYSYIADIDFTFKADKTHWLSIYAAVEAEVPASVLVFGNYNTFNWAFRSTYSLGETDLENTSVYTFGDRVTTNPGWFNDFPGQLYAPYDFQLWA